MGTQMMEELAAGGMSSLHSYIQTRCYIHTKHPIKSDLNMLDAEQHIHLQAYSIWQQCIYVLLKCDSFWLFDCWICMLWPSCSRRLPKIIGRFDHSCICWHIAIAHIIVISHSLCLHCSAASIIKACSICQSMSKTATAAVVSAVYSAHRRHGIRISGKDLWSACCRVQSVTTAS